jgi:hypothetical protein
MKHGKNDIKAEIEFEIDQLDLQKLPPNMPTKKSIQSNSID